MRSRVEFDRPHTSGVNPLRTPRRLSALRVTLTVRVASHDRALPLPSVGHDLSRARNRGLVDRVPVYVLCTYRFAYGQKNPKLAVKGRRIHARPRTEPLCFCLNYLTIEALQTFHFYSGEGIEWDFLATS